MGRTQAPGHVRASTLPLSYYNPQHILPLSTQGWGNAGKGVKAPQRGVNLPSCLRVFLAWGARRTEISRADGECCPWGPSAEKTAWPPHRPRVESPGWVGKYSTIPTKPRAWEKVRLATEGPCSRNRPLEAACAGPGATAEIRATIDLQNAINCLGQEAD